MSDEEEEWVDEDEEDRIPRGGVRFDSVGVGSLMSIVRLPKERKRI